MKTADAIVTFHSSAGAIITCQTATSTLITAARKPDDNAELPQPMLPPSQHTDVPTNV
jgi:hypothetical protein